VVVQKWQAKYSGCPKMAMKTLKLYYTSFGWRKFFTENSIWNTAVPLPSYSFMFQVEICSQQLEICKSVCMFIVLAVVVESDLLSVVLFRWLPIMTSWRKVLVQWLPIMTSWRKDKQSWVLR
jgi:hypothetical protein